MTHETTRPPRVLLADDHELVRAGLQAQLQRLGSFETVHAWSRETLLRAAAIPPGCALALVDLNMPGMNGAEGVAALCEAHPNLPVIVITGAGRDDVLSQSRAWSQCTNICGVLHKTGQADALRGLIDIALTSPRATRKPVLLGTAEVPHVRTSALTQRQREVAMAAAGGMTNQQIAAALALTEGTVKNHLQTVFRLLGVSNRTQLALRAHALDLDERPESAGD